MRLSFFCWLVLVLTSCGGPVAAQSATPGRPPSPASRGGGGDADDARDASTVRAISVAQGRMVIKIGHLDLVTRNPQEGFQRAVEVARELGGYTLNATHGATRASVTLRVPAPRFEEALKRLGLLGKVSRREVTGTDVTAEFVDLSLRLSTAEKARQRYLELLERAGSVQDALAVQRELERVNSTIEQLRGRINLIRNQVGFSTIHLSLETPTRPGPIGWIFYGLYHAIMWLFVWY